MVQTGNKILLTVWSLVIVFVIEEHMLSEVSSHNMVKQDDTMIHLDPSIQTSALVSAWLMYLRLQGMSDSRGAPAQFGRGPQTPGQHPDQHHQQTNGDSYNGPDSLRNTASKMFNRNGGERSSGYNGNINPSQGGGYPNSYGQSLNQSQQNLNHSLNHSLEMSHHSYEQTRQQQGTPSNVRPRQNSSEDPAKRNSYNNQSFSQ